MKPFILVIEDERRFQKEARDFFGEHARGHEFRFASNWEEIKPLLLEPELLEALMGIICDSRFPLSEEFPEPVPLCTRVLAEFHHMRGIPLVVVSSLFHHHQQQEWISDWLHAEGLPYIIDDGSWNEQENPSARKNWRTAWEMLLKQMDIRPKKPATSSFSPAFTM